MGGSGRNAIELEHVVVEYGGVRALGPVSLEVPDGSAALLTGPNGSGKTTLLRLVAGSARPTAGTARVHGRVPDGRRRGFRAEVAALIDRPTLAYDLTLREHLVLVGLSWGMTAAEGQERGLEILAAFDAPGLAQRFPHELSSGQLQMFALALTLVRPCDVLLLDESEQRLDAARVGALAGLLEERRAAGTTLLVATHDPAIADTLRAEHRVLTGETQGDAG